MSSSWLLWPHATNNKLLLEEPAAMEQRLQEALHRKRLAAILRYIASMHEALRSAEGTCNHSFVRPIQDAANASDFFQFERMNDEVGNDAASCGVLFSTNDFRRLIVAEAMDGERSTSLWSSPPFSFYATSSLATAPNTSSTTYRDGTNTSSITSTRFSQPESQRGQGIWLRVTRLGANAPVEQPEIPPIVHKYLQDWLNDSSPSRCTQISDLLTIHHLERAPGIPSTVYTIRNQRIIKGMSTRRRCEFLFFNSFVKL
jgi:hypothetical protein